MLRTRVTIVALAASAALLAGAASASASPLPPKVTTAATFIQDRPDGGNGNPDTWADDTMLRSLVITRTGGSAGDWTFTARLTDAGAFTTIKGAQVPNQAAPWTGDTIRSAVTGLMTGWADFTFTASTLPTASVPRSENDHGQVPADDTSTWYELAFPHGTSFTDATMPDWSWSYFAFTFTGLQQWTDSLSNGYGDLAGDGQITG